MNAHTKITFTADQLVALTFERGPFKGMPYPKALEAIQAARDIQARYPDATFSSNAWNDEDSNKLGHYPTIYIYRSGKNVARLDVEFMSVYDNTTKFVLKGEHVADNGSRYRDPSVWRKGWGKMLAYIVERDALRTDNPEEAYSKGVNALYEAYIGGLGKEREAATKLVHALKDEALNVATGMGNTPGTNALRGEANSWVAAVEKAQADFEAKAQALADKLGVKAYCSQLLSSQRMKNLRFVVAAIKGERVHLSDTLF